MEDDLVAFEQPDADALLNLIDSTAEQSLHSTHRAPRRGAMAARSKSTGMPANSASQVILRVPTATGWADGPEIEAFNDGAAVPGNKRLLLIPVDGRNYALRVEC